jgi:hypothetical protein
VILFLPKTSRGWRKAGNCFPAGRTQKKDWEKHPSGFQKQQKAQAQPRLQRIPGRNLFRNNRRVKCEPAGTLFWLYILP